MAFYFRLGFFDDNQLVFINVATQRFSAETKYKKLEV